MNKVVINEAEYNELLDLHKNKQLEQPHLYANAYYVYAKDGVHGVNTYSHDVHQIPSITTETVDSVKSYYKYVD